MTSATPTAERHDPTAAGIGSVLIVLLIVAQLALYAWMAPRGFDFTDESFYLLNYLHWRELAGLVSFFGFYLELPFRVLGQSITAMRVLTLLLLMACAAGFTQQCLRYVVRSRSDNGDDDRDSKRWRAGWPFVAVGMAASLFYFGYLSTLRAPSYNLLVLCSMLLSTALLLRSLGGAVGLPGRRLTIFLYGVLLGVCGLSKATSGLLLAACHAAFFVAVNRDWRLRPLSERVLLTLAGVTLNAAVLTMVHPGWIESLRGGIAIFAYTGHSQVLEMVNGFGWDIQRLGLLLPWAAALVVVSTFLFWRLGRERARLSSLAITALVAVAVGALLIEGQGRLWWPSLLMLVVVLCLAEGITRGAARRGVRDDVAELALLGLLFALPLAYSFGTAMPVLEHSRSAAVFGVVAVLLRLCRLNQLGLLVQPALFLCLAGLCLPTLWIQMQAVHDVRHTYRQASALAAQKVPVQVGRSSRPLLVDADTRAAIDAVVGAARDAGLTADQPMLDFTGEGPGLVYALNARPLGVAWLVGGYPDSGKWAGRVLDRLPKSELRRAWVLASSDNPRAIPGWQRLVEQRLGAGSHELVATVRVPAPSRWGALAPATADLQLWRPGVR